MHSGVGEGMGSGSPPVKRSKRRATRGKSGGEIRDSSEISEFSDEEAGARDIGGGSGKMGKMGNAGETDYVGRMGEIARSLRELLLNDGSTTKKVAKEILEICAGYETIIVSQNAALERLRGNLETQQRMCDTLSMRGPVATAGTQKPTPMPRRITPTYAVVVRNADPTSEVIKGATKEKVLQAGQKMGEPVKVKAVRELRDGGVAVIASTPSDLNKIRKAPAFAEAGLKMANPKMAEPQLMIMDVPTSMTNEVLVGEVLANNLQGYATKEELGATRVVNRMGRKGVNSCKVVLETPKRLREYLCREGRVYVGFSSFRVREYESVPRCYGCGSFGHMLGRCPTGRLCHNCGVAGHTAEMCQNAVRCRNCALRGLEASHRVTSTACPCYTNECEKRRGRIIG